MIVLKTAEFKNGLSRFLQIVRETGESITVCDRDKPVVKVIPYQESNADSSVWVLREADEKINGSWDEDFDLPNRKVDPDRYQNPLD